MKTFGSFRFYETTPEGRRYRRSTSVGTVTQYPTKTDALRIIEPLRLRLNPHHRFGRPVSVDALVGRYVEHELPERRHSTQQSHSSILNRKAGDTKTEASRKALPLDPRLAAPLTELWKSSFRKGPQDWVFVNRAGRPRGQQDILQRHLRPAAVRAGIGKIGWHTFRHSYSTMLRAAGADIKVQQELLRHSTIQSTMNIYTQAVSEQKRAANNREQHGGRHSVQ